MDESMEMNAPASTSPGGEDAGMRMPARVTRPRIVALALLTVLMLAAGTLLAGYYGDFGMRSGDMASTGNTGGTGASGGMPGMPGMGSGGDTGGTSGMDMRPADTSNAPTADPNARGNQPLQATIAADGAKEFQLSAGVVKWNILPGVQVGAFAYNNQVPGPLVRVTLGDRVRVFFTNNLPEPTTVHWHGLILDNAMDGAAGVTQPAVQPGQTFTYEFTVEQTGTYFYHTHTAPDRQQTLGLYGALIIDPPASANAPTYAGDYIIELGEWTVQNGQALPSMNQTGLFPNYFTINGKSYPSTETITAKVGDKIRFRFIGTGQFIHPMHIHGGPFDIIETDGNAVPAGAQLTKDTVLVGPGERYDVVWTARKPGKWLLHCHINDHITNNGQEVDGGGGLTMIIDVAP